MNTEWVQIGRLISLTLRALYAPPLLAPITNRERKDRWSSSKNASEPGEGTIMQVAVRQTGGGECVHSFLDSTVVA
jgi:hypothetical protein